MIDIHSHILPGMDDGAPDFAATSAMLAMARADGITAMVATPHADLRYRYDAALCAREISRIRQECPEAPLVYSGCELHLTPENLDAVLHAPASFTMNGTKHLLLELPDQTTNAAVEAAVQVLAANRLRPVIAHPERNRLFHRDPSIASRLFEMGAFFQVTAQSVLGSFGREAQRTWASLLKLRMVHMIASDAHGVEHRRPLLSAARAEVTRMHSRAAADLLFLENPDACVMGRRIENLRPARSFFSFLRSSHDCVASIPEMS